jgi:uncharacterized membrane protein affecting hemolysin expression
MTHTVIFLVVLAMLTCLMLGIILVMMDHMAVLKKQLETQSQQLGRAINTIETMRFRIRTLYDKLNLPTPLDAPLSGRRGDFDDEEWRHA